MNRLYPFVFFSHGKFSINIKCHMSLLVCSHFWELLYISKCRAGSLEVKFAHRCFLWRFSCQSVILSLKEIEQAHQAVSVHTFKNKTGHSFSLVQEITEKRRKEEEQKILRNERGRKKAGRRQDCTWHQSNMLASKSLHHWVHSPSLKRGAARGQFLHHNLNQLSYMEHHACWLPPLHVVLAWWSSAILSWVT